MTAIYHPGVIQVVPQYNIGAPHKAANVLYYFTPSVAPPTLAELVALQTTFNTWWSIVFLAYAATGTSYVGAIVTDMGSNTGLQANNATYTPNSGTHLGGPLSDGTAVLVSQKTALRYKGGHGRVYLPGIAMECTQTDGRTVSSGIMSSIDAAIVAVQSHMGSVSVGGTSGVQPIIWHKKLHTAPNSTENIIVSTTQAVLASQRRRLRKVPRHRTRLP